MRGCMKCYEYTKVLEACNKIFSFAIHTNSEVLRSIDEGFKLKLP